MKKSLLLLLVSTCGLNTPNIARAEFNSSVGNDYVDFNDQENGNYLTTVNASNIGYYNVNNFNPINLQISQPYDFSSSLSLALYKWSTVDYYNNLYPYAMVTDTTSSGAEPDPKLSIDNLKTSLNFSLSFYLENIFYLPNADTDGSSYVSEFFLKIEGKESEAFVLVDTLSYKGTSDKDFTKPITFNFSNAKYTSMRLSWRIVGYNLYNRHLLGFEKISLSYSSSANEKFAKTYAGSELITWWENNGYEYDIEDNDYYYITAEPYCDREENQYLSNITFVFNQNSNYLFRTNYILHIDFTAEFLKDFTNIKLYFENTYDGLNLNTDVKAANVAKGFNFVIPAMRECQISIFSLFYNSFKGTYTDNAEAIKSISIIPYTRRFELLGEQFYYFGATDFDLDMDKDDLDDAYNEGFQDGAASADDGKYDQGKEDGYEDGYSDGSSVGYDIGYKAAKNWWTDFINFWENLWKTIISPFQSK